MGTVNRVMSIILHRLLLHRIGRTHTARPVDMVVDHLMNMVTTGAQVRAGQTRGLMMTVQKSGRTSLDLTLKTRLVLGSWDGTTKLGSDKLVVERQTSRYPKFVKDLTSSS